MTKVSFRHIRNFRTVIISCWRVANPNGGVVFLHYSGIPHLFVPVLSYYTLYYQSVIPTWNDIVSIENKKLLKNMIIIIYYSEAFTGKPCSRCNEFRKEFRREMSDPNNIALLYTYYVQ